METTLRKMFLMFALVMALGMLAGAANADISGTYVEATQLNTTSITNSWYAAVDDSYDNLWWDEPSYPSLYRSRGNYEDCPTITTTVAVPKGMYDVYVLSWMSGIPPWNYWEFSVVRAALQGGSLSNLYGNSDYGDSRLSLPSPTNTGVVSYGNILGEVKIGTTAPNVTSISVDIDDYGSGAPGDRIWNTYYTGISYVPITDPGTYVPATLSNTTSTANPWHSEFGAENYDNLWQDETGYPSLFRSRGNYEDCPTITTTVSGLNPGKYDVFVHYWLGGITIPAWGYETSLIRSALHGESLANLYDDTSAVPTDIYSYGVRTGKVKIGTTSSNVTSFSVDVDDIGLPAPTNRIWNTYYTGISYAAAIPTRVYVPATLSNTTSNTSPWYAPQPNNVTDDLWNYANEPYLFASSLVAMGTYAENCPILTTTTPVEEGKYDVYVVYWKYSDLSEKSVIRAALQGKSLANLYDDTSCTDLGLNTYWNIHMGEVKIGTTASNVTSISVDIDDCGLGDFEIGPKMNTYYAGIAYFPSTAVSSSLTCNVTLEDYYGDITVVPVTVELNGTPYTVNLDGSGNFTILDVTNGTYDVRIKASHWLAKMTTGVVVDGDALISPVSLINGDVVDNNEVDFDDINATRTAYGSFPGDENWNERADVDGSGEVDFSDINTVRSKYGEIGD